MEALIDAHKLYSKKPDITKFSSHTHDTHELFCFLTGDAGYYVEGTYYNLQEGDILLIKKAESHSLVIKKEVPYSRFVINFSSDALTKEVEKKLLDKIEKKPLGKFNRIPAETQQKNLWFHFFTNIVGAETSEEKSLYLSVLVNELCDHFNMEEETTQTQTDAQKIIEYINRNLWQITSLDEISHLFFVSKTHLNRKFKAVTGSTVWEYIVTKKLLGAKDLLLQGCKPKKVCERCGYAEYSAFYRAYKKRFGVSPDTDYKKG